VGQTIKLSSPASGEFWEIPVLWEDAHLLALHKPGGLLVSPDRNNAARPNLMKLLHGGIEKGAAWAKERGLVYLMNAHRLDAETGGVLLLAKTKPALVALADQFGSEKPNKIFVALVRGSNPEDSFATDAPIGPHPLEAGVMRVDTRAGLRARTGFVVRERFPGASCLLLECRPLTSRPYQIRAHLKYLRLPIVGDAVYGGPPLLLSSLKSSYHLKPGHTERPLIAGVALHAEKLTVTHPVTGAEITITAPWPKDFNVAVKYLRRYSAA
jgi:RluA family pseudouridine synthase